jgi:hypothetical protein
VAIDDVAVTGAAVPDADTVATPATGVTLLVDSTGAVLPRLGIRYGRPGFPSRPMPVTITSGLVPGVTASADTETIRLVAVTGETLPWDCESTAAATLTTEAEAVTGATWPLLTVSDCCSDGGTGYPPGPRTVHIPFAVYDGDVGVIDEAAVTGDTKPATCVADAATATTDEVAVTGDTVPDVPDAALAATEAIDDVAETAAMLPLA